VPHYEKLKQILVVFYDAYSKFEEYVFKCKWLRVNLDGANQSVIQDECGHTRLKTSATSYQPSHWQTSEPFTFCCQVEQCFPLPYPPDPEEWSHVVTYVPRSCSIIGEKAEVVFTTSEQDDDQV
jgi:hypothetical protein